MQWLIDTTQSQCTLKSMCDFRRFCVIDQSSSRSINLDHVMNDNNRLLIGQLVMFTLALGLTASKYEVDTVSPYGTLIEINQCKLTFEGVIRL